MQASDAFAIGVPVARQWHWLTETCTFSETAAGEVQLTTSPWQCKIALQVFGLRHPQDMIAAIDAHDLSGGASAVVRGQIDGGAADGL